MQDFACQKADDMHYKVLADRVRYFKEDEKGVKAMCKAVEELCKEEKYETKVEIVGRMLAAGTLSLEEIAMFSGLTLEEIKEIAEERNK